MKCCSCVGAEMMTVRLFASTSINSIQLFCRMNDIKVAQYTVTMPIRRRTVGHSQPTIVCHMANRTNQPIYSNASRSTRYVNFEFNSRICTATFEIVLLVVCTLHSAVVWAAVQLYLCTVHYFISGSTRM